MVSIDYRKRNREAFLMIEAIIEKIEFGKMRVDLVVHQKRITSFHVYGKQRIRPKS